jgi:hypothetical protein
VPPPPETSSSGQPGEVRWRCRVAVGGNAKRPALRVMPTRCAVPRPSNREVDVVLARHRIDGRSDLRLVQA